MLSMRCKSTVKACRERDASGVFQQACRWLIASVLALLWSPAFTEERQAELKLEVWGGGHSAMLEHAVLAPFEALAGVSIDLQSKSKAKVDQATNFADAVELELHEAIHACDNGDLALLPGTDLFDFVPDALQPCAVGQYIWSTVYAYNRGVYRPGREPSLITDFFDITHYPGRRAIVRSPRVIAEWALLASGIPASEVNDTLQTPEQAWLVIEGMLAPLSQAIVWVDDDIQAMEMLRSGAVSLAMVSSDTLLRSAATGAEDLVPVWDGAVNQMSLWAIPANSKQPDLAWQFVRYATSTDATRRFSSVSGYGPSRFSALEQISRDYHRYLPSARANLANVVWGDSRWWRESGDTLDQRFVNWLARQFVGSDS